MTYQALSAGDLAEHTRQMLVAIEQKIHGHDVDILMNEEVAKRKQDKGEARQVEAAVAKVRKERAALIQGLAVLRRHYETERAAAEALESGAEESDALPEPLVYPTRGERHHPAKAAGGDA